MKLTSFIIYACVFTIVFCQGRLEMQSNTPSRNGQSAATYESKLLETSDEKWRNEAGETKRERKKTKKTNVAEYGHNTNTDNANMNSRYPHHGESSQVVAPTMGATDSSRCAKVKDGIPYGYNMALADYFESMETMKCNGWVFATSNSMAFLPASFLHDQYCQTVSPSSYCGLPNRNTFWSFDYDLRYRIQRKASVTIQYGCSMDVGTTPGEVQVYLLNRDDFTGHITSRKLVDSAPCVRPARARQPTFTANTDNEVAFFSTTRNNFIFIDSFEVQILNSEAQEENSVAVSAPDHGHGGHGHDDHHGGHGHDDHHGGHGHDDHHGGHEHDDHHGGHEHDNHHGSHGGHGHHDTHGHKGHHDSHGSHHGTHGHHDSHGHSGHHDAHNEYSVLDMLSPVFNSAEYVLALVGLITVVSVLYRFYQNKEFRSVKSHDQTDSL